MTKPPGNRAYAAAAGLATIFIVYASLYPWRFHSAAPLAALDHLLANAGTGQPNASGLIANVALYLPLGLFCAAALRTQFGRAGAIVTTVIFGSALCLSLEFLQFFDANRVPALADAYTNIAGTGIGAALGVLFAGYASDWMVGPRPPRDAAAILLLLVFVAYRLFPYVPSVSLQTYWHAVKPIWTDPAIEYWAVLRYAVLWCTVAALLHAASGARLASRVIAPAMAALLIAQVAIVHNRVALAEIAAMPIALVVWYALRGRRRALTYGAISVLLALVVVSDRLLPFDWRPVGHAFGWVPFASLMHGSMTINLLALLEKLFTYAGLVWLLREGGCRLGPSAVAVAAGLFATSWLQTHLAGRSAEITDALIALCCGLLLGLLQRGGPPWDERAERVGYAPYAEIEPSQSAAPPDYLQPDG